ncbi:hypothetical protein L596_028188 [Steinernema carpocapsae]|uniref:DUF19 domain-containing protein n=1 Tax=Steinernema carpocapsae TaxID=34508 RepID=A0A4U5LXN9_STECR|nr:hypothetical protein L596_028188 [Steinernema carpocapsae]
MKTLLWLVFFKLFISRSCIAQEVRYVRIKPKIESSERMVVHVVRHWNECAHKSHAENAVGFFYHYDLNKTMINCIFFKEIGSFRINENPKTDFYFLRDMRSQTHCRDFYEKVQDVVRDVEQNCVQRSEEAVNHCLKVKNEDCVEDLETTTTALVSTSTSPTTAETTTTSEEATTSSPTTTPTTPTTTTETTTSSTTTTPTTTATPTTPSTTINLLEDLCEKEEKRGNGRGDPQECFWTMSRQVKTCYN